MRRVVLLGGGVLLAAAIFVMTSPGGAEPRASIQGPALEPKQQARETAAFQALAEQPKPAAHVAIDFDRVELVGDHYEAPTTDGHRARLTLDPDLQATAEKLLAEARAPRGAIVALAPDGRILALAGRRTAEPKGGTKGTSDWHLAADVWAPAASVFKLVTASALVQAGVDPADKVCYHGGLHRVVDSQLRDSKRDNACNTLSWGVAHSNNAIVGKLAFQHLEPAGLEQMARDLGLGAPLADSFALHAAFGELALPHTKDLDLAQAAAGFTGTKLSVLGGALLAATFADDGEQPAARIVDAIDGVAAVPAGARRVLPEATAQAVAKMMVATCESGSAAKSFGRHGKVKVAGKTGTLTTTEPFEMENSWFVGYAPVDKPEVVVAVLLGNAENWHLRGHEAARRLIDRAIRHGRDHDALSAGR